MNGVNFESNSEKRTLEEEFRYKKEYYFDLKALAVTLNDPEIQEYVDQIENEDMIGNIEKFLQTSENDVDAQDKANSMIKDFAEIVDHIKDIACRIDPMNNFWWTGNRATGFGSNDKWR